MVQKSGDHQLRLVVCPCLSHYLRFLLHPRWLAGFLPSTVAIALENWWEFFGVEKGLFSGAKCYYTPQMFNMEPENASLEKEKHLKTHQFWGSMLNFRGVVFRCTPSTSPLRFLWLDPFVTREFGRAVKLPSDYLPWINDTSYKVGPVTSFHRENAGTLGQGAL